MKNKRFSMNRLLLYFLLFETLFLALTNFLGTYTPSGAMAEAKLRRDINFIPNPTYLGGLNSCFTTKHVYDDVNNITFPNDALMIPRSNQLYQINVTSGGNLTAYINNWFDDFGTEIEITSSGSYTLQIWTRDKAQPETIRDENWNSLSYSYSSGIVTITVAGPSTITLLWGTAATTRILNPGFEGHHGDGEGNNINGYGLVAGQIYTFQTKVYVSQATMSGEYLDRVELELASGLSRMVKLEFEENIFTEIQDEEDHWTLFAENCNSDPTTIFYNSRFFTVNWTGKIADGYTPKNAHESTRTIVYLQDGTSFGHTELEQYYVCSTVYVSSLELLNPETTVLDSKGIIAEYRTYYWQVIAYSTINYADFDYLELTLGCFADRKELGGPLYAYDSDYQVTFRWTRQNDINVPWTSYHSLTNETDFEERKDPENLFFFEAYSSSIEVYNDTVNIWINVTFAGYFMLHYPTRNLQDAKVYVIAENDAEDTEIFDSLYWVETEWFTIQEGGTGMAGWLENDPFRGFDYWNPNVTSEAGTTSIFVPNFQMLHTIFTTNLRNSTSEGFEYGSIYYEFEFFKNGDPVEGSWTQKFRVRWQRVEEGLSTKEEWFYFQDFSGSGVPQDVTWKILEFGTPASDPYSWGIALDAWVTSDSSQFAIRVTNINQTLAWSTEPDEWEPHQWAEYKWDLEDSYLSFPTWGVKINILVAGVYGGIEIYRVDSFQLQNDEKKGVQDPELILPTQRTANWGIFEWLRKGLLAMANFIANLLRPFFMAIVNTLSWLAEQITRGAIAVWMWFVPFINSFFEFFGWEDGFYQFIAWISILLYSFANSVEWFVSLMASSFIFFISFMGKFTNTLGRVVAQWSALVETFFDLIGNAYGFGVSSWELISPLILIGAILYPFFLFLILCSKGIDGVLNHLKMIFDIFAFISKIFLTVIQMLIDIVSRLIEMLPVVE